MPEPGLIRLIKGGDREAFNTLCRNRYASLISYARLVLSGLESSWAQDKVPMVNLDNGQAICPIRCVKNYIKK